MVDHFHEQVQRKNWRPGAGDGGDQWHERAIQYFVAVRDYLKECKSPYRYRRSPANTAMGQQVTEAALNGFASNLIQSVFVRNRTASHLR